MTVITLVRHGETEWNAQGRIQGHLDVPLNRLGMAQAAALGQRLKGERFDAVYSSDLGRAYQTASAAVGDATPDITRDARLRERHLGVLQGLTGAEAADGQPRAWKVFKARDPDAALDGGESLAQFFRRVADFLEDVLHRQAGGRILAVTHGGVLDAAYRHAAGMPLAAARDFSLYNASINVIVHDGAAWKVESWGDVTHLPQELSLDDT